MTSKSHQIDMLNGPLLPRIIAFALPLAFASILQQLFNAADIAIVGRFTGNGMAAVGANSPIVNILIGLASGLAVGVNIHVAGLIGRGHERQIKNTVSTIFFLAVVAGLIVCITGIILSKPILHLMGAPNEVISDAVRYLRIYCLGVPFAMLYNFASAILRSHGDTRRPLYALAISGVFNIILNLFFVAVLRIGVSGVAIATDMASALSAWLVIRIVLKEETTGSLFSEFTVYNLLIGRICRIGLPAAFQGMLFSISNMFVQSAINSFGTDAIAGNTAALNYEIMSYYIPLAIGQTVVTFTSQNLGAGRLDRCKRAYYLCMALAVGVLFILNTTVVIFGHTCLSFFTTSEQVIYYGLMRFNVVLVFHVLICSYEVTAGALRGYGYAMLPTIISIVGTCLLRPTWIMTFFRAHKTMESLLMVYPVSWVVTGVAMITAYCICIRKINRNFRETNVKRF